MRASPTDFDLLGGEAGLRAIIADFTGRAFSDLMIGFMFNGKPKARITEMEYRFAAAHLGGPAVYTGRSMREAHRSVRVQGGQFMRRRKLLADTLADHKAPPDVAARWLAHVDSLADQVLAAGGSRTGCD